ncbi:hypothetical protein TI39_contig508g00001 [Zymoseptoria brevis]|uniref:Uncharacterized protein n=1 Tax=Zymoseptoria brevis TaxID=1047168 RepID=A0A0F4GIQ3_9PEZI|nr:hypothetical protein TI39_contig508g00001 [Zymoseptoria brevis]
MSPSINMIMLLGAAVAWAENAPMGYQVPPAAMTTAAASPADCAATFALRVQPGFMLGLQPLRQQRNLRDPDRMLLQRAHHCYGSRTSHHHCSSRRRSPMRGGLLGGLP